MRVSVCRRQRILFERPSKWNDRVLVVEEGGEEEGHHGIRTLYFGTAESDKQSVFDRRTPRKLHLPYVRSLCDLLSRLPESNPHTLMIGLGGGSIARRFRDIKPRAWIDIVELDNVVIEAATKYMGFEPDRRMRLICAEGRAFIEACNAATYDLIILDAFGVSQIPHTLSTKQFLASVLRVLKPGPTSHVMANLFGPASCSLYPCMLATWNTVFDCVSSIRVPESDNQILLAPAIAAKSFSQFPFHRVLEDID